MRIFLTKLYVAIFLAAVPLHLSTADSSIPPSNCAIFNEYLSGDSLQQALGLRDEYADECLSCIGDECYLDRRKIKTSKMFSSCKVLFCTPTQLRKTEFSENAWGSFSATVFYKINQEGKGELERVEFTSGKLPKRHQREVKKVMSKRLAYTRWEPLIIDGEAKSLSHLNYRYKFKGGLNFF